MSPAHTDLPAEGCPSANLDILSRIGDKWSLHIVGFLRHGPKRFNEIKRNVTGISQRMLTLTLRGLERDGLVTRTILPTRPPRVDYELTGTGKTLLDPVLGLINWAVEHQKQIQTARQKFDRATARQEKAPS